MNAPGVDGLGALPCLEGPEPSCTGCLLADRSSRPDSAYAAHGYAAVHVSYGPEHLAASGPERGHWPHRTRACPDDRVDDRNGPRDGVDDPVAHDGRPVHERRVRYDHRVVKLWQMKNPGNQNPNQNTGYGTQS